VAPSTSGYPDVLPLPFLILNAIIYFNSRIIVGSCIHALTAWTMLSATVMAVSEHNVIGDAIRCQARYQIQSPRTPRR
jgi:hypothetical protein